MSSFSSSEISSPGCKSAGLSLRRRRWNRFWRS
ncbi:hypothetical protein LINPERPRIM_LOCUS3671 [Linum perenne]